MLRLALVLAVSFVINPYAHALGGGQGTPVPEITVSGLVAEWRMDDGAGTTMTDYEGSNDATFASSPNAPHFYTRGVKHRGSHYATAAAPLSPADGDFSAFVVFKADQIDSSDENNDQVLIDQEDGTGTGRVWLLLNAVPASSDAILLESGLGGSGLRSSTDLRTSRWYMAGVTVNGTTKKLWLGDTEEASETVTMEAADGDLVFGGLSTGTKGLRGAIAYIAVFNKALSSAEVTQLKSDLTGILDARDVPLNPTIPDLYFDRSGDNPVVEHGSYAFDSNAIRAPDIFEVDASTWGMLASTMDGTGTTGLTYYTASKASPHAWTAHGSLIVSGDYRGGTAIDIGGTWHVYAHDNAGDIELFTGASLSSLTSQGIVLAASTDDWDGYRVHPTVFEDGGTYYLLYDFRRGSYTGGQGGIGLATSADGSTWTESDANPLLDFDTGHFPESDDLTTPGIATINGNTYLFYGGWDGDATDYPHWVDYAIATGDDYEDWVKSNVGPILAAAADWEGTAVVSPTFIPGTSTVYFQAGIGGSSQDIGYATLGTMPDAYDNFTAPDGTDPDGHTMNTGQSWTKQVTVSAPGGSAVITDGKLTSTTETTVLTTDASNADATVRVLVQGGSTGCGPAMRTTDFDDAWLGRINGSGDLQIVERDGGASTVRDTVASGVTTSSDYELEFAVSGTTLTLKAFQNGSLMATASYTSSLHQTTTTHGVWYSSGLELDEFRLTIP